MDSANKYLQREQLLRRDEQALWNGEQNLAIMRVAAEAADWYRERPNAAVPQKFLSVVTNPGNDGECNGSHRLKSMARAMRQFDTLETESFIAFRVTSYELLEVLKDVAELPELDEAGMALDAFFDYLNRSRSRKCEDSEFATRVMGMVDNYIAICHRISSAFLRIERSLLEVVDPDPAVRRRDQSLAEINGGVAKLLKRAKTTPASVTTRMWMKRRWEYFKVHPEALKHPAAGRRVCLKDVWETDREEAISQYGIADLAAYRRIAAANRQAESRQSKSRSY